jgi:hypothetical protein
MKFSFTQSGFEAYQGVIEVLSAAVGASYQVDANKHWLPVNNGTQNIGSGTYRIGTVYASSFDGADTFSGSLPMSITNTSTGTGDDARVFASNGTTAVGVIARSALNNSNEVAGTADMLFYTNGATMSWFWGSNLRMRANTNVVSMGTIDPTTGAVGTGILTGAWAPTTNSSGGALNDKNGAALVLAGGAGTGLGTGGLLYFSYFPAGSTGNVQGSRINIMHVDGTGLVPELNATYDSGSSLFRWNNTWTYNADISNNLTVGSTGVINFHAGSFYKTAAGRFGFFTTSPTVDVQVGGGATYRELRMLRNVDGATAQALVMMKSRGTESVPTAVLSGDSFGSILAGGYDSTGTAGYRTAVSIGFTAAAAATGGILPGRMYFGVQPASPAAAGIINYMTIGEAEVRPVLTNVTSLGTSAVRWSAAYTTALDFTGALTASTGIWAVGTNQFYKDASGNIGLGTATPGSKLHLYASAVGTQYMLTLENDSNAAGTATDVGLVLKAHNGTASAVGSYIFLTNSLWATGVYGANTTVISSVAAGGLRLFAEGASATVNTYVGGNAAANLVSTAQSTGLTINNTQNFTAGNLTVYQKTYSVAAVTNVPIELTKGVSTLTTGNTYRVKLITQGTTTITGSSYLISYNGTSWVATQVSANTGSATNHPQLSLSGTTVNIFHSHATSTYVVFAYVETLNFGGTAASGNMAWGADSLFSYEQNSNVVTVGIAATTLSVPTLSISGAATIGATGLTVGTNFSVTSAGDVNVGRTSTLGPKFSVQGAITAGTVADLAIFAAGNSGNPVTGDGARIYLAAGANVARSAAIEAVVSNGINGHHLAFLPNTAGAAPTEAARITNLYEFILGNGNTNAAPASGITYRVTNASGTNIAGADVIHQAGAGTGTGAGGAYKIRTAPAGTTGAALNAFVDRFYVGQDGKTGVATTAPAVQFQIGDGTTATGEKYFRLFGASTGADIYLGQSTGTVFSYTTGTIGLLLQNASAPLGIGTVAAQPVIIGSGNTGRQWFDGSGRIGVGSTPATNWFAQPNFIDFRSGRGAVGIATGGSVDATFLVANATASSNDLGLTTWTATGAGQASKIELRGGIRFAYAGGLTAGGAITWTDLGSWTSSDLRIGTGIYPATSNTYSSGSSTLYWSNTYTINMTMGDAGQITAATTAGRTILAGGTDLTTGAAFVARGNTNGLPGAAEIWSHNGTAAAVRWTVGGTTSPGHLFPATTGTYDIGTSALHVRAIYADVYPDNPSKNYVKWATTTDIAPSTYTTGATSVLTGYANTATVALTTTAGGMSVTTPANGTAGVKVGAAVSVATVNIPANSKVYSVGSSTVMTLLDIQGWTLATTAIVGTGTTATATFAAQTAPPYSVGTTIYISGATPSTYNGAFTVTAVTSTTVSWASAETVTATVQGSITNMVTTAITGTGTAATATFAARTYAPFAVGASITISGATPATYNGTFTVTACTTTSVSWASTETVTATVQGYVQSSITAGTAVNHTFAQTIAAFTPDGTAAAVGDRVLVKDMTTIGGLTTDGRYTGAYTVTTVGSTTVAWVLTRASDSDTIGELAGATYVVLAGTANGGKSFRSYAKSTDTLDTTPIVWNKLIDQLASTRGPLPVTGTGIDIATDTKTVWLTGGNVAAFAASSIGRMTVVTTSASTYTTAASLYIAGSPIASTNTTMTTVYSLQVAQGMSYFAYGGNSGGSVQAVGLSTSYGVLPVSHVLTGAVNVVMGAAAAATWLLSGTSNGTFRGGIQLLDAGGAMRLYSNTTTGVAVSGNDVIPFATGNGNVGTSVLRFAGLYGNVADIAGNIKTTGATGVIGYGTGSGGTVTQLTSKATGVTVNKGSGFITTAADALAAGAAVAFTFTNSTIATTADSVVIHRQSGGTAGAYNVWVDSVAAGSCVVYIKNISGASLSEAVVLSFKVIAGATA